MRTLAILFTLVLPGCMPGTLPEAGAAGRGAPPEVGPTAEVAPPGEVAPLDETMGPARVDDERLAIRAAIEGDYVRFDLENTSGDPLTVLPALDGSEMGWRVPSVVLEYRDRSGEPVAPPLIGRCGNMNPLRTEDFVALTPGARTHLTTTSLTHRVPEGAVELRVVYDTTGAGAHRPLGDLRGDPDVLLADLPKGLWTSPWVRLPGH